MGDDESMTHVTITRQKLGRYTATNEAGETIEYGEDEGLFSSVELLLAALGGCTGIDVDYLTSRRAEPESFEIEVSADKTKDEQGRNCLADVQVTFRLRFGAGEGADEAREVLPQAVAQSHDRLCTVGRTIEQPTRVTTVIE